MVWDEDLHMARAVEVVASVEVIKAAQGLVPTPVVEGDVTTIRPIRRLGDDG